MKHLFLTIVSFLLVALPCIGQEGRIIVKIHSIEGYGQYEDFARKAAVALEKILNSETFRQEVLKGTYIKTDGLTNQELYERIMKAHELQGAGGEDRVVDLRIRTLRINGDESDRRKDCEIGSHAGTLGIDGNGDGVTAICPQRLEMWVKEDNVAELAGHFAHEYMHILGFGHYKFLSTQTWREKTFVYKMGDLVSDLIAKEVSK